MGEVWQRRHADKRKGAALKALGFFEQAAETNPHLPVYRVRLALFLAELGLRERALVLLRELESVEGVGAEVLVQRIVLELDAQTPGVDYAALLTKAQERGADPHVVARLRAEVELDKGTPEAIAAAQASLARLLESRPADAQARVLYAMTHLKQFDRKAADAAVRKGFGVVPDAQTGLLRLARAEIASRTGKLAQAAPLARSAWTSLLSSDAEVRTLLKAAELGTRLWLRRRKDTAATRIARDLTDRLEYHADAWTIRARAELGANEAAEARSSADRAIELDPKNPRAHEIRGHCLLRFGEKELAREAYNEAIKLSKGSAQERAYKANLKRL